MNDMPTDNKEGRLNLRLGDNFKSDMEILAHAEGLTLPQWAKATFKRIQTQAEENEIFQRRMLESVLTLHKVMERTAEPDVLSAARRDVSSYIKQVEDHARRAT